MDSGASTALLRQTALVRQNNPEPRFGPQVWSGLTLATLSTAVLSIGVATIFYISGLPATGHLSRGSEYAEWAILGSVAYAIGSSGSGVLSGCLDGAGFMTFRVSTSLLCNVFMALAALYFLPRYGFFGFIGVQCGQVTALCLLQSARFIALKNGLATASHEYRHAVRDSYRNVIGSVAIGAARIGFEPATKIIISHVAGLPAVAIFDLVNRVSGQIRQLLAATLQPLAIAAARQGGRLPKDLHQTFWTWTLISLAAGLFGGLLQVTSAPIVSLLVLKHFDGDFIFYSNILSVSTVINSVGVVAFLSDMAGGRFSRLIVLHIAMLAINLFLSFALGMILGAPGAVIAWTVTLSLGGLVMLFFYIRDQSVTPTEFIWLIVMIAASLIVLFCTFYLTHLGIIHFGKALTRLPLMR
jgi:O-antigen/teichoic acid export membrane protein